METLRRLESPKIWAVIKTQTLGDDGVLSDGSLTDPTTSVELIIEDSVGTVTRALVAMTKDSTGKYSYSGYTIPADAETGLWNWEVRSTDDTGVASGHGSFMVEEQIA